MTIQEMHYDFKMKFNKIDSEQYRNLRIPEIDWVLNEAQELFIKMVAEPRNRSYLGFEVSQRSIDDIRTLVVNDECLDVINNIAVLPKQYMFYVGGHILMSKGNCRDIRGELHVVQHDDEFQSSPFDKSSFEWREVNCTFFEGGLRLYDDGTFTNDKVCISYIKKPEYIHYASGYRGGTYNIPGTSTPLTGTQDCVLPEHTHREIVDIAVLIATGNVQGSDYEIKRAKLGMNQL